MFNLDRDGDTICAVSTPPGVGGIAVIRLCGPQSLSVIKNIAPFIPDKPESHRVYYGFVKKISIPGDHPIDEVLISYFARGRSFTGEDTFEISCHGGSFVSSLILKELMSSGARIAEKGEFTYRAFMSGRLDLVQAESILQLIESQSEQALKLSLRQLKGELSTELKFIEDKLTLLLANLEANIDFSSEDIEIASNDKLLELGKEAQGRVEKLLLSYHSGRLINEGLKVGLIGEPNVGKSSLLNAFSKEEIAIVTDVAGTTRDFVYSQLLINGIKVQFVDTAGLRETNDKVESIGIRRTKESVSELDILFVVVDLSREIETGFLAEFTDFNAKKTIFLGNKADIELVENSSKDLKGILAKRSIDQVGSWLTPMDSSQFIKVSALNPESLRPAEDFLLNTASGDFSENSATISQARHFELLSSMKDCIIRSMDMIYAQDSPELIAFEMQDSLKMLHEILGKEFDDEIMDRVFSEFCLGK